MYKKCVLRSSGGWSQLFLGEYSRLLHCMNHKEKAALAKQLIGLGEKEVYTYHKQGVIYRMLIVFRGEGLFYAENDQCLVFDRFSARKAVVSMKGVDQWLDGTPFADRERLKENLKKYYKQSYEDTLEIEE